MVQPRLLLLLVAFALACPHATAAENPEHLWVAPLGPGQSLETARAAGAVVRDRFPGALLVADEASAAALAEAGFTIEGPLAVGAGKTVTLLRPRRRRGDGEPVDVAAVAALPGVEVLWSDGFDVLVEATEPFDWAAPVRELGKKVLAESPIRSPRFRSDPDRQMWPSDVVEPITFPSAIDPIVAEADPTAYMSWIRFLAGADPITIDGQSIRLMTRYTNSEHCDLAEQWAYESLLDMGFASVEYDTFFVGSSMARNVIATLPGTETPERIYILCGHLDSTSEMPTVDAPGANDNASGAAVVLEAARILKDHAFRSTIRFCLFTGEEQGLLGSMHYANEARLAGDSIRGVVNCDMVAYWDDEYGVLIQGPRWCDGLMHVLDEACDRYTGLDTEILYSAWGSDHVSFVHQGFPAFLAIELDYSTYPCYHRTCDRAYQNSPTFGADVLRASLATISFVARVDDPALDGPAAPGLPSVSEAFWGPNPFAERTALRFGLAAWGRVDLDIYDVSGRLVRHLVGETRPAGEYRATWDGRDDSGGAAPAGVYFSRLETEGGVRVGKLIRSGVE
jgi:hypothetical protein